MLMHERDQAIVQLVGRFGQLAAGHLKTLLFADNASETPLYRSLSRLTHEKYLAKIERRMIGGTGAGSGQFVYQLGSKGWVFCQRDGPYWPLRAVNYHTIAIADAFVALQEMERAGIIKITRYETEPDTHRTIAGAKLTPDLYLEFEVPSVGRIYEFWPEIDLGNERMRQLTDKLKRYQHAYARLTDQDMETFPVVLFLVPDEARRRQIEQLIAREVPEDRALFMVKTMQDWPASLFE